MSVPIPDETILGLISANPQHGYQILSHFNSQDKLGLVWNMSTSQVYAVLNRLEKNSLIIGSVVGQKDAPVKKEYSVTPLGRERLHAWLYDLEPSSSIRRVRVEFSSKLYIARLLNLAVEEIIELQRTSIERQLKRIEKQYQVANNVMENIVSKFILGQLRAVIMWLDELPSEQQNERNRN